MSGSFLSRSAFICLGLILACSGDLTFRDPGEPASPEPATLRIVSGDDQRSEPGSLLEDPLRVQVLDGSGEPMGAVSVQFNFVGELPKAGLDPSSTLTDEEGEALAVVRLGSVPGEQLIAARVTGTESPQLSVWFRATALAGDDGGKKRGGGNDGDDTGGSDDDDDDGSGGDDDSGDDD